MHATRPREFYGWGQAAWCCFPFLQATRRGPTDPLPFYMNPGDSLMPWGRGDWDRLIGSYRVTTDFGSMFSKQLITHYPEAKVILVQRPVEKWMASFEKALLDGICYGVRGFILCVLGPFVGEVSGKICKDVFHGFLQASSRSEAISRMPIVHKEHADLVRRMVPSDQLLDYKLGDGWEPLCQFLDLPIPDAPFPHINDTQDLLLVCNMAAKKVITKICIRLGYCAMIGMLVAFVVRRRS